MFRLFRRQRVKETGAENAQRFVDMVKRRAHDERMVLAYPSGKWTASNDHLGWVWMINPQWRKRVHALIAKQRVPVKDVRFHAPDSMDGWTFSATSTVPVPRVATLTLEETLW